MKDINIAKTLIKKRKEKGITQDELANYIGVSKASVSKWETKQSYPDITFLPQLATFFDISIDELISYEPQLSKDEIQHIYLEISKKFTKTPFDEVMTYCRKIIKKYFSCYPLLYQMGVLIVNNSSLANNKSMEVINEAKELFTKVRIESQNIELEKQSLYMESMCMISLGNPSEVIDLLGDSSSLLMSKEALLASAYQMKGEFINAKKTLQIEIYQYSVNLIQLLQSYLSLYFDDEMRFDEICKRIFSISDTFNLEELHPMILLQIYLMISQKKLIAEDIDEAIKYLEKYARLATGKIHSIKLKGDSFFDLIDEWFKDLDINTNPPRDESIIKQSILESVINNPAFSTLAGNTHYENVIKILKDNY